MKKILLVLFLLLHISIGVAIAIDDSHRYTTKTRDEPATEWFAVTPSDSVDFTDQPRAIWVGVAGDVVLVSKTGTVVTFKNVSGLLPVRPVRINATGTTATDITGMH